MTQSLKVDPGLVEFKQPLCPKCRRPMTFAGLVFGRDGVATRNFECDLCNHTEKVGADSRE